MTGREVLAHLKLRLDETSNPGWYEEDFNRFINSAVIEWVGEWSSMFEKNEAARRRLTVLIRKYDAIGNSVIPLSDIDPNVYRVVNLSGEWNFECRGVTTSRVRPIMPIGNDFENKILDDPDNQPTDAWPVYVEDNGGGPMLRILSTNDPLRLTMTYLKQPDPIAFDDNEIELTDESVLEIIERAVRKITGVVENTTRVQSQAELEAPALRR